MKMGSKIKGKVPKAAKLEKGKGGKMYDKPSEKANWRKPAKDVTTPRCA